MSHSCEPVDVDTPVATEVDGEILAPTSSSSAASAEHRQPDEKFRLTLQFYILLKTRAMSVKKVSQTDNSCKINLYHNWILSITVTMTEKLNTTIFQQVVTDGHSSI